MEIKGERIFRRFVHLLVHLEGLRDEEGFDSREGGALGRMEARKVFDEMSEKVEGCG